MLDQFIPEDRPKSRYQPAYDAIRKALRHWDTRIMGIEDVAWLFGITKRLASKMIREAGLKPVHHIKKKLFYSVQDVLRLLKLCQTIEMPLGNLWARRKGIKDGSEKGRPKNWTGKDPHAGKPEKD